MRVLGFRGRLRLERGGSCRMGRQNSLIECFGLLRWQVATTWISTPGYEGFGYREI